MGHHYIPQRYLKAWEAQGSPGSIWTYDKQIETRKPLPIRGVAQSPGYYEVQIEKELAADVEKPGNDVIDKIRRGETIDEMDRRHLTYYLGTMIRRVPTARANAEELIPQAMATVSRELKEWFATQVTAGNIDEATLASRVAEIDSTIEKFTRQPPTTVTDVIRTPWPFVSTLVALHGMTWRICRSEGPSYFLTSDNPAYCLEPWGLGQMESELVFPLCPTLLLHGSWEESRIEQTFTMPQYMVKECNRRIATGAGRFIFYDREADWVFKVAFKAPSQLNQFRWNT